jgi:Leucine-rich repeat (LRR) protein
LYCSNNQLTQLDVSKNINLEYIYCSNNQLSQLDVSKNTKLKRVDCSRNVIDLKGLWSIKSSLSSDSDLVYEKQNNIFSMVSVSDVYEADYTEQAVINGENTVFKWYNVSGELVDDNSIIEPVAGITGKFLIKSKGAFYCQMSNPEFPDLKINTKLICFSSSTEETVDIPDVILKGYLLKDKAINTNLDGEIQLSEAHNYKSKIWVFNKGIKSLKGIESFVNITELHCRGNWLKEIDVSKNTKLKTLICSSNKFEELDVSKNTELKKLDCYNNQLTQLDLSNNTELTELSCGSNKLTQLDISKNIELNDLNCGYNQLTEFDVSKNTDLKELSCGSNKLTQLDISKNTKLTSLVCDYNQLTELDVSKNIELTGLNCRGNRLTHFDVSKNTKLTGLYCGYNKLTELDVSKNIKLTSLSFDGNILTKIDISKNPELTYLDCQRNKFSFTELWNIKSNLSIDAQFDYEPQNKIFNKQNLKQNAVIDYSLELTVNGKTTNFVWYNAISNSEVDETSVQKTEDGKFKFLKYGQYYCKMTNAEFEDLELQTNTIYILKDQTLTFDVQKTVFVNDKITLNATVSSGLDITYEIVSGKATLDGNILTPTAEGTLVIKAVQAGNYEYEPVEKEVTIQVTKRDQTITFDVKETAKLNEKITLAAIASSNLDVTYEVVSGNATLDGSTVTFTEVGKVQIKAKQAGNKEYKAVEKVVTITVTKSTAIDNLSVIGAKIYPNPITDILNIELPTTGSYRVTVLNSIGDVVTQKTASSVNTTIDMSAYNSGIYIIKVTTGNRSYTGKIIKQ